MENMVTESHEKILRFANSQLAGVFRLCTHNHPGFVLLLACRRVTL